MRSIVANSSASSSCSAQRRRSRPRRRRPASTQPDERDDHQRLAQLGPARRRSAPAQRTARPHAQPPRARRRLAFRAHATADLHRAPAGRDVRPAPRGRAARRGARLRRVLPLRPLPCASARATPGPGSTDAWMTLAALGRETVAHPARHARHAGDVPPSRTARDPGRAGRRDERRPRRARARRGLVRRRARGVRRSRSRRPATASRCSRSSSRSSTGMWTTPAGETFSFAGKHHQRRRLARAAEAGATARGRRSSSAAGARSARRGSRRAYADEFNMPFAPVVVLPRGLRPRARRVRERSAAIPRRCGSRSRPSCASGATRPSSGGAPRRSARIPTTLRANAAGGHARRGRRAHPRVRRRPAPRPCTSSSSTLDDLDHLRADRGRSRCPTS